MKLAIILLLISGPIFPTRAAAQPESTICIAMPRVQGLDGDAVTAAEGLRDLFASYLTGPSLKSVLLDAKLTSQAMEEARLKNCERVLITALSQKRKGGSRLGKVVGEAAETALWHAPGVGAATRAGTAAGARAISTLSATTRARDEFMLEYRMDKADGTPLLRTTIGRRKANVDGEDLLTPLVERASETVAAAIK